MKIRRIISVILTALMLMSALTVAATAADTDVASTGAANQSYLETYAAKAASETQLGATYTPTATTFKVWSPEASSVMVKLFATGTDAESGAATLGTTAMTYDNSTGIWSVTLNGDYKNTYYTYLVDRNGVVSEAVDPYAKAVGANGNRGMVVDLDATDPDGWDSDKHVLFDNPGEAVVWEIHVRDFSIDVSSGVSEEHRGKYLAFTEGNTTVNGEGKIASCVDYLVEHNVNCVQLMPIEDFASIDETDNRVNRNWGYDPKNYNVPDGSYSTDPYNGNTRITEFKMLVQALHDRGIAVVMDVVYNHTFVRDGSQFSKLVPKYYYRMSNMNNNTYHNGSGLGNVLSTEKTMTRKFVQDSLVYWATEYHIDGFRFDLMGCHDIPSVRAWRTALDQVDSRILMYGEPWTGGSDNGISNGVTKSTMSQLTRVGAFNEGYSDALKGSHETATGTGFLNGGSNSEILKAAGGTASDFSGAKVEQMVNYTDNHDNWTLFDKILAANRTSGFTTAKDDATLYTKNKNAVDNPSAQVLGQVKLGLTSALTSQGIPFTVAGTEFARTKYGDQNSYRSPDNMNGINWNRAEKYAAIADYYAGLVAIRKAVSAFGDTTANAVSTVSGCTAWQLTNNKSGEWNKIIVALNNSGSAKSITCSGSWTVVANGTKAGTASLGTASGSYSVPAWSSVILVDSASFGNYKQPASGSAKVTVEHYTRDSASGSYSKVLTEKAEYKEGQTWRASKSLEILFDHDLTTTESTAAGNAAYGEAKAGQDITVKFYYTRNIASQYVTVNFLDTTSNAAVKTAMKYRLREGDKYSIPATPVQGYQLDTSKYPQNTIGTFEATAPVTFNFYYTALTNTTTKVHYYNTPGWSYVNCYAYDDAGNEALGAWANQSKRDRMTDDPDQADAKWLVKDVPSAACYVMFHDATNQVPDAGEPGYSVAGEAWIKDGVTTFNCTIVTSHIDLATGEKLADDVVKNYTNVGSNQTYSTTPERSLNRNYIAPALASGFYQPGILNVVYLYTDQAEGKLMYGDVDLLDSIVTIMDVTVLQRGVTDLIQLSEDQNTVSDVNADDIVDITDATTIQRYLAEMKVPGSRVGRYVGDAPVGEYTYDEFLNMFNALSTKLAQYPAATYGNDPYYQAAAAAIATYRATSLNPSADPDEVDAGYKACALALAGTANIQIIDDPTPTGMIIFSNNKGFSSVNIYYWADGSEGPVAWPGVPMDYYDTNDFGETRYSFTMPDGYDHYIINDGEKQTVDITFSGSTGVYMTDEQDDQGHYYVDFYDISDDNGGGGNGGGSNGSFLLTDNFGWGVAYVYAWDADGNPLNGEWPGSSQAETVTNDYGETQFRCYIPEGAVGVILNNGNGAQTEDITDFSYDGYWMDGSQNDLGHYIVTGWNA